MKVKIRLQETSQAIIIDNVENTYTKGPFYCVFVKETNKVRKFPVESIFEVEEDYSNSFEVSNTVHISAVNNRT